PATDPLAERCPQRRADDPPGRIHPAIDRRPVRRYARHRRGSDPHTVFREGDLRGGLARDPADALRVLRQARHHADAAAARRGGESARRARGDDAPLVPSPVDRADPPAYGRRERHDPRRGRGASRPDRAALVAARRRDVRPQGRRIRSHDRARHPAPRPAGTARGARVTGPDVPVPNRVGGRGTPTVEEVARRMARRADPAPGHQRLLGLAAVTALSVATALAFGRVFTGRQATLELVAAALASVAIAALFE